MALTAGEVFAGYTVVRLLGSGGMGEVYLAQHPRLPRQDAVKILPAAVSADPAFRARFDREADLAATLWHPHIVGVHDRGDDQGRLWIAMDFVDGSDAARLLRDHYPAGLPVDEVLDVVTAVADALDYAHERHLLHRDVKPANILLTRDARRRILLADFGVARRSDDVSGLTATDATIGSPAYTAPEQLLGNSLDGRADQYSLAVTAYQLLCGAVPFADDNPTVVISRHLTTPPPALQQRRPDLAALSPALATALAKNPNERFATCQQFAAALRGDVPNADDTDPAGFAVTRESAVTRDRGLPVYVSAWHTESDSPTATFTPGEPTMAAAWSQVPPVDEPPPAPQPAQPPPPAEYPSAPMPEPPPSSSSFKTWALVGAAAVIVVAVTLAFALTPSGSDDQARSTPRPSAAPAAPTGSPSGRSIPPTVADPDGTGESCPTGYAIDDRQEWGSAAIRGNDATTCAFTGSVLQAYWNAGPPSRTSRTIVTDGAEVSCGMEGTNPWISCRGVGDTLVYLF